MRNGGFEGPCHGETGNDYTVRVQDDPVCYGERVTICPECGDVIVRGTAIIWKALLNSVQEWSHMVGSDAVSVAMRSHDMAMMSCVS